MNNTINNLGETEPVTQKLPALTWIGLGIIGMILLFKGEKKDV